MTKTSNIELNPTPRSWTKTMTRRTLKKRSLLRRILRFSRMVMFMEHHDHPSASRYQTMIKPTGQHTPSAGTLP